LVTPVLCSVVPKHPNISKQHIFEDDFTGDTLDARWNSRVGSNPQCVAAAVYLPQTIGLVRLVAGDDAAGTMAVNGSQLEGQLHYLANAGGLRWQARVKLPTITDICMFVGFTDQVSALEMPFTLGGSDALTSNATDAVGFLFDTAADTDNIWLVGVANDVDATKQNAGQAFVANTFRKLAMEIDTSGNASFYIQDTLVGSVMTGAVTPSVRLAPVFAVFSRTTATRIADMEYICIEADREL
jgi:hypothetical protein